MAPGALLARNESIWLSRQQPDEAAMFMDSEQRVIHPQSPVFSGSNNEGGVQKKKKKSCALAMLHESSFYWPVTFDWPGKFDQR